MEYEKLYRAFRKTLSNEKVLIHETRELEDKLISDTETLQQISERLKKDNHLIQVLKKESEKAIEKMNSSKNQQIELSSEGEILAKEVDRLQLLGARANESQITSETKIYTLNEEIEKLHDMTHQFRSENLNFDRDLYEITARYCAGLHRREDHPSRYGRQI